MLRDDRTELDALVAALSDTSRVQRAQASLSDLLRSASGATTLPLLLDRLLGVASRSAAARRAAARLLAEACRAHGAALARAQSRLVGFASRWVADGDGAPRDACLELLAAVAEHVVAGASGREAFALLLRPQLRALEQPSRGVQQGGALALREVAKALGDAQLRYGVAALAGAARRQLGAAHAHGKPELLEMLAVLLDRAEEPILKALEAKAVAAGGAASSSLVEGVMGACAADDWRERRAAVATLRALAAAEARRGAPVAVTADQRLRLDSALEVLRYDRVSVVRQAAGAAHVEASRPRKREAESAPRTAPRVAAPAARGRASAGGDGGGGWYRAVSDGTAVRCGHKGAAAEAPSPPTASTSAGGAAPPGGSGGGFGDAAAAIVKMLRAHEMYLYATVADTRAAVHAADRRLGAAEAAVAALAAARRDAPRAKAAVPQRAPRTPVPPPPHRAPQAWSSPSLSTGGTRYSSTFKPPPSRPRTPKPAAAEDAEEAKAAAEALRADSERRAARRASRLASCSSSCKSRPSALPPPPTAASAPRVRPAALDGDAALTPETAAARPATARVASPPARRTPQRAPPPPPTPPPEEEETAAAADEPTGAPAADAVAYAEFDAAAARRVALAATITARERVSPSVGATGGGGDDAEEPPLSSAERRARSAWGDDGGGGSGAHDAPLSLLGEGRVAEAFEVAWRRIADPDGARGAVRLLEAAAPAGLGQLPVAAARAVVSFITDELRAERHVRALLPWLDAALDLRLRPKGAVDLFGGAAWAALSRTLRGLSASAEESGVEAAKLYALVRGAGGGPPTPRPEWLVLD